VSSVFSTRLVPVKTGIKHFRAVATRYDKRDDNFLASVKLASLRRGPIAPALHTPTTSAAAITAGRSASAPAAVEAAISGPAV